VPPATHLVCPEVMSFINAAPYLYKAGLTHPSDPLPIAMRAALTLEKKPATAGDDADVPLARPLVPPTYNT
jgi:hypothetical protein